MTAWEPLRELWSAALDAARSPKRYLRRRRALKRVAAAMRRTGDRPAAPESLAKAPENRLQAITPKQGKPRSVPPEE